MNCWARAHVSVRVHVALWARLRATGWAGSRLRGSACYTDGLFLGAWLAGAAHLQQRSGIVGEAAIRQRNHHSLHRLVGCPVQLAQQLCLAVPSYISIR